MPNYDEQQPTSNAGCDHYAALRRKLAADKALLTQEMEASEDARLALANAYLTQSNLKKEINHD